nr:uncharacterized protein LOC127305687 isoform X2 [Lolium perenne]
MDTPTPSADLDMVNSSSSSSGGSTASARTPGSSGSARPGNSGGSARTESSSTSGGCGSAPTTIPAVEWSLAQPLGSSASAPPVLSRTIPAVDWSLPQPLGRASAPPVLSRNIQPSLPSTGTGGATPTALEESTLHLASGLESMNLTGGGGGGGGGGGEPPAVERPSTSTTVPRKRTPGRWRRIPRMWYHPPAHTPEMQAFIDKGNLVTLENIEFIKNMQEKDCHLETEEDIREFHAFKEKMVRSLTLIVQAKPENIFLSYKRFSDTREEHLTAEGMEAHILQQFPESKPCQQAKHFAELALKHYNKKRMESRKFKLATTLLSNCFSESSGTTYGHVNFTAILEEKTATQPTSKTKRLFFAELMLIPKLQADPEAEPMRVVHVYVIDDDYCYGGCKKIFRKIDHKMRREMDYERCHACSDLIKHPKGQLFDGGHNSSRMPYFSAV